MNGTFLDGKFSIIRCYINIEANKIASLRILNLFGFLQSICLRKNTFQIIKMSKYAIDCEMVGSHNRSLLARVSIVNQNGQKVLDEYVKPTAVVTDYRTCVSGIKRRDLENGRDLSTVRTQVANLLRGKILIGHSLQFDLEALGIDHPERNRRDLAKYEPILRSNGGQPVALKTLARNYLGRNIQNGDHDSLEDAKACMDIYNQLAAKWEQMY